MKTLVDPEDSSKSRELQRNFQKLQANIKSAHPAISDQILTSIKDHEAKLDNELNQLKKLIAASQSGAKSAVEAEGEGGPSIVYVGPDMEAMLDQTERNLESKMKLQTVLNVVLVYAALAVTVPVLYAVFRGMWYWKLNLWDINLVLLLYNT